MFALSFNEDAIVAKDWRFDGIINFEDWLVPILFKASICCKLIYSGEGFDFEIVCPYCEYEFIIDADEDKNEVECPECNNTIELDWSGDLCDDEGCSGHCHGCSSCGDSDEDDDM